MPRVSIIGAGNVAHAFGKRLLSKQCDIHEVYARDAKQGTSLAKSLKAGYIDKVRSLDPKVDIIIVAVSDDSIKSVARKIPNTKALVVHCSGATSLTSIPHKTRAVTWPLRSISRGQRLSWKDMNMVIQADSDLAAVKAMDLITLLGARAVRMDSKERKTAHLVAVILNNFSNHLLHMADVLCETRDMDRRIFQDLMAHTLQNQGPALESQTGPAARGDEQVMERQRKLLKQYPNFQKVYEVISESISKENHDKKL